MSTQDRSVIAIDPHESWMLRAGGISALVIGIGYLLIMVLFIPMGAPPSGAEAWLQYMGGNIGLWWAILGLSVLTDFLFVPVAFSLPGIAGDRAQRNAAGGCLHGILRCARPGGDLDQLRCVDHVQQ